MIVTNRHEKHLHVDPPKSGLISKGTIKETSVLNQTKIERELSRLTRKLLCSKVGDLNLRTMW